jgi:hypothetical protein
MQPETRSAKSGDVHIAYQAVVHGGYRRALRVWSAVGAIAQA